MENQIVFKTPTVKTSACKIKAKILTEEKYIEELSKIIQRDFFPDLEKLRVQNAYLDAEARKDYTLISEIYAKYTNHVSGTNSLNCVMSPATFETPVSTANSTPRPNDSSILSQISKGTQKKKERKEALLTKNLSLNEFLERYTSEDNYSFQEIIETAQEKLRKKFAILYNQEELSTEQLKRALILPSIEQQFNEINAMRKIDTWKYTNMNSIMYVPDGVDITEEERIKESEGKQIIQHSATRLPVIPNAKQNESNQSGNKSSGSNAVAFGINAETPGFNFLKTPSPHPGRDISPIMTWGEIEGTPFRLDGCDTPIQICSGPSFKINENSRRENIGIALADKVGAKMRAEKQKALNTVRQNNKSPFIRSNMQRLASMSPAAQRFATTKLGLSSIKPITLTPTPYVSKRKQQTPQLSKDKTTITTATAQLKSLPTSGKVDTGSTLTDDLLNIPTKRLRAVDFF